MSAEAFPCGDPRTEENTYLVFETRAGRSFGRCRKCAKRKASERYAAKRGTVACRPVTGFCADCARGACKHARPCLRAIAREPKDHPCRCGVAWPLAWKREIAAGGES